MQTEVNQEQIKDIIISQLPEIIETDKKVRHVLLKITEDRYADREKTEDRIDRILDELKRDREKSEKRWEEARKADAQKWDENNKKWDGNNKKWDENNKKWEENNKKWEENHKIIKEMLASIKKLQTKHESSIGALGARWGLQSEKAFRDGLKSILEDLFNVKVERYQDFDHDGIVFGRPDQIEMDVIIHNGTLILCEIKSSVSKSDLYAFWRKKEFYENKHQRKADRTIVISPMTDKRAADAAKTLGIEVYGYAENVVFNEG